MDQQTFTISLGGFLGLAVVAHVVLAVIVFRDADQIRREGGRLELMESWAWAVLALASGIPGAAFYWLFNRSRFTRRA